MDAIKDQSSSASGNTSRSKLQYPLRSASKSNDHKSAMADTSTASSSKNGRPASNVSSSVTVLDLSGKDKSTSTKPLRRLSIPAKSTISPLPSQAATITPISEDSAKRSDNDQGKNEAPVSDVSKPMNRRKFNVLSSSSYWLSQIKISESAAKHSISLGFFKLALEAGCEPLQRMRDELKSYAYRNNLGEFGEPVKELLRGYNISEDLEQLQVSKSCSQAPAEVTRSSVQETHSSASSNGARKSKPKSLNSRNVQTANFAESAKEGTQKRISTTKNNRSVNKNSANLGSVTDVGAGNIQKKSQRPSQQASYKEKEIKNQGKKAASGKDPDDNLPAEEKLQDYKENTDSQKMEEISLTELIENLHQSNTE